MPHALSPDFRVLFEKSPGLCLVLDPHFFVLAATDEYLEATMTRRESIVGQHLFDVFKADDVNVANAAYVRNLRSSLERLVRDRVADSMAVQKYDVIQPEGGVWERYWSPLNTPILDVHRRVKYIIHSIEDVTGFVQLKKSGREGDELAHMQRITSETDILSRSAELGSINEQLKLANEELAMRTAQLNDAVQTMETFTYSIAHDLRAPLRAMLGFSGMVLEECGDAVGDRGKDYLARIKDAAHRMERLVADLLIYGRLTHVDATSLPISLEQVVNKALDDLRTEIRRLNARVDLQRPLPSIIGSPVLVNHVLLNVIDNALKFMPEGRAPHVVIYSTRTDDVVRLHIKDNGIGIAPEYHRKIFDLFVRLHKPSEYSGTGIGLALVKKAMDRMLGKVGLDSKVGGGSCFWLEFRAAK